MNDDGSLTTELAILTPVLIWLLVLTIFAGRVASARSDVVSAAGDGARAASIQRSDFAARQAASETVRDTLAAEGVRCRGGVRIEVDFLPAGAGFGGGNYVRVTVRCDVNLTGLSAPGVGSVTTTGRAVEIIDEHRGLG